MPPLANGLRNDLENVVKKARVIAERGAKSALETITVHEAKSGGHLDAAGRELRARLRAHAKQLGDIRKTNGEQAISRLIRECAYEHWHRMLFARFLAENDLLIHPQHNVSVSLDDVQELAREQHVDQWELASRFAQRMLPQIFRPDDPVLAVALPRERTLELEQLLESLQAETFKADDSLGWVYQFWQAEEKDRVNASGEKITGETLPAVTQLFTEHYMVLFLLHNTIGAWWAGKRLADAATHRRVDATHSEAEVRAIINLPDYQFEYLRFVHDSRESDAVGKSAGAWRPMAGTFDGWPRRVQDLKILDPCCGSGHFLAAAFELLVRLHMADTGVSLEAAIRAVLADNLFGLELDARCTQIAAFNLALAAWRMGGTPINLSPLNIACSGLAVGASKPEWAKLADSDSSLKAGLERLHDLFQQAPDLGSLIDPKGSFAYTKGGSDEFDLGNAFHAIQPLLAKALAREAVSKDEDAQERAVAAQGMSKAAEILSGEYSLVITNVPYLGRGAQGETIKSFCEKQYPEAKADLATAFVARILRWLVGGGTTAVVTPQNWLFLTSYSKLRERLLKERSWNFMVRMGEHAFESSAAAGAFGAMVVLSADKPARDHIMTGIDVSAPRGQRPIFADEKAALLRGDRALSAQRTGSAVLLTGQGALQAGENTLRAKRSSLQATRRSADVVHGTPMRDHRVSSHTSPGSFTSPEADDGPADGTIKLVPQAEQLKNPDAVITLTAIGTVSLLKDVADGLVGILNGDCERFECCFWESTCDERWEFEQSTCDYTQPFGGREKVILWDSGNGELRSFARAVRERLHDADYRGNQAWGKWGVAVKQIGTLPVSLYNGDKFDTNVAVILPKKAEYLPAIWAFCSAPDYAAAVRRINQKLNVTNASLVKVPFDLAHWQRIAAKEYPGGLPEPQSDDPTQWLFHGWPEASTSPLQVAVARLVGYCWPAELDDKITLAPEARAWVERCKDLKRFADDDGIVCISAVRGERPAADRLLSMLTACSFKHDRDLDTWLRESFFDEHCALFHNRPFVWHIWDGRKDGFHALVNYHKLAAPSGAGRRVLTALTHAYLGDWIRDQKDQVGDKKPGAEARLTAALDLKSELEKILTGEPPYDIFVRWKPLHEQPIGWEPDMNDGVRLNIRPFLNAKDVGRKGAGVLRCKPSTIKWGPKPDRGNEPQSLRPKTDFPWFWGCDPERHPLHQTNFPGGTEFDGNRWNDLHYTNAFKQAARERKAETSTCAGNECYAP